MALRHYLQWHITHRCNLSCLHCYQEDAFSQMQYDNMQLILNKYAEYLSLHHYEGQINLTGGEPLLHPDFFKLSEEIVRRGIRLGILTNGTLIDRQTAEKISLLKPVFVQISLDGTEKIHDEIRGMGQFQKAMEGVRALKKYGVRVLISFTAMKQNYACFEQVANICKECGVDKLWWDRVVTDDSSVYLSTEEFKELSEEAYRLKKKYAFLSCDRALQGLPGKECGYSCSAGKRLLIILANGDMMACRRLPFVLGNISSLKKDSLEDYLRGNPVMQMLAKPSFPKECVRCNFFKICGAGAKCVTYAQTGKLGEKDVNCYL